MRRLPEAVTAAGEAAAGAVRVARTARVTKWNGDGTVDLQPDVAEAVAVRGVVQWVLPPEQPSVPLAGAWGGSAGFVPYLAVGQRVLCVLRDVDHTAPDDGSPATEPVSARRWDWSDAVVVGGTEAPADGYPSGALPANAADLVAYMASGGVLYVGDNAAALLLARADLILAELQALATHTHAYSAPTGGNVPATTSMASYTAPLAASEIASDRVKVKS